MNCRPQLRSINREAVGRSRIVRSRIGRNRASSSAEGCPAEGGCRVRGFGFSSGFWGRKQKQNKNKMKRENKKKIKKVKKAQEKKMKEKEETEQTPSVRFRPINFDFGQFRLRPISTSANFDFGQFRFRPAKHPHIERDRLRPISISATCDFGQFLNVEFWDDKVWGPRKVEPLKGGGAQNFALFPSSATFFFCARAKWVKHSPRHHTCLRGKAGMMEVPFHLVPAGETPSVRAPEQPIHRIRHACSS